MVLSKKLLPKLKDPGSFMIPCTIGNQFIGRALCELGASINLMPLSIYKELGLKEAKSINVTLQLADKSITYPKGIVEDVLVKVDKFIFPANFVELDFEEDRETPIILGRPFLETGRTVIGVQNGELTMRVNDHEVKFNVFKAIEFPNEMEECYLVKDVNDAIGDDLLSDNGSNGSSCDELYEEKETMNEHGQFVKHCWCCTNQKSPNIEAEPG